jgi:hypothetical protein
VGRLRYVGAIGIRAQLRGNVQPTRRPRLSLPHVRHRHALYEKARPDLVLVVGLMSIRKKEEAEGRRHALAELDGKWETVREERMPLPGGFDA